MYTRNGGQMGTCTIIIITHSKKSWIKLSEFLQIRWGFFFILTKSQKWEPKNASFEGSKKAPSEEVFFGSHFWDFVKIKKNPHLICKNSDNFIQDFFWVCNDEYCASSHLTTVSCVHLILLLTDKNPSHFHSNFVLFSGASPFCDLFWNSNYAVLQRVVQTDWNRFQTPTPPLFRLYFSFSHRRDTLSLCENLIRKNIFSHIRTIK